MEGLGLAGAVESPMVGGAWPAPYPACLVKGHVYRDAKVIQVRCPGTLYRSCSLLGLENHFSDKKGMIFLL